MTEIKQKYLWEMNLEEQKEHHKARIKEEAETQLKIDYIQKIYDKMILKL